MSTKTFAIKEIYRKIDLKMKEFNIFVSRRHQHFEMCNTMQEFNNGYVEKVIEELAQYNRKNTLDIV